MLARMCDPNAAPRTPAPALDPQHPCAPCPMRSASICAALGADRLAQLKSTGRELNLPAGHSLYRQHDAVDALYLLRSGLIRLTTRDAEGREQVLAFRQPGALIGLTARARHAQGAETVQPSRLCRWPGNATALAARHPELAPPLLGLSLQALDGACDQALRLGRHAATARLAGFLLELLSERPGQNELQLAMKRADIAAHLGLNKESVSRSFTQLRRAGAIALPRPDRVHLLRPDRLRELAHSTHPHPVLQPARPP